MQNVPEGTLLCTRPPRMPELGWTPYHPGDQPNLDYAFISGTVGIATPPLQSTSFMAEKKWMPSGRNLIFHIIHMMLCMLRAVILCSKMYSPLTSTMLFSILRPRRTAWTWIMIINMARGTTNPEIKLVTFSLLTVERDGDLAARRHSSGDRMAPMPYSWKLMHHN